MRKKKEILTEKHLQTNNRDKKKTRKGKKESKQEKKKRISFKQFFK